MTMMDRNSSGTEIPDPAPKQTPSHPAAESPGQIEEPTALSSETVPSAPKALRDTHSRLLYPQQLDEMPVEVRSDPSRSSADSGAAKTFRRRGGPRPTLRRINRRTVTRTVVALFCCLLALEVYKQARIEFAQHHFARGDFSKALRSLEGTRYSLFRHGLVLSLENEARFHAATQNIQEAVAVRKWFVAEKA
jgi:hypothetical protein